MIDSPRVPLCRQHDSQLVVVDVQEKLSAAMATAERRRVLSVIATLLQAAKLLEVPVALTEQYPKGLGPTEATLKVDLTPKAQIFEKTSFSCCEAAGFTQRMIETHRRQVIVTGMEAHVCVLQTALELQAHGFEAYVVEDGVCSRDPRHHVNAMDRLRQAGVIVTNHESLLFEWMRDATHPHFKIISSLLKSGG
jgi:nicotinamidase-related amidase